MEIGVKGAKPYAFSEAIIRYHPGTKDKQNEIQSFYREKSGINRVKQLRMTEEKFNISKKLLIEEEKEWSDYFSSCIDESSLPLRRETIETLEYFSKKGIIQGIASSIPEEELVSIIREHYKEIIPYLSFVLGNKKIKKSESEEFDFVKGIPYFSYLQNKFKVKKEDILFVGDSIEDIKAGKEAGISVVILDAGYYKPEEIKKNKPFAVIDDLNQLKNISGP